ncbi:hypothetical protein [Pseudomonas linyingensis]|nr:hypothetical protein [Pseudomonas linyingensis]
MSNILAVSLASRVCSLPESLCPSGVWRARIVQLLLALALLLLAGLALAGWRHLYPVRTEAGWSYATHLDEVEKVSALVEDGEGGLLLSQELGGGKGRLLRLASGGELSEVQVGLSKPDGMIGFRGGVVFSQEQGELPVLWRTPDGTRALFVGRSVEGLASDGRYLYAIEDRHGDGSLLRFDPERDVVEVLRRDLDEAEAVTVCPDGRLFYGEKGKGWIRQLSADGSDPTVLAGLNQPGFLLCNDEGLWVSEDATHMARLLLLDQGGQLHTVLSHLRSAQTLIETTPGHYLLAEQGRNRVLKLQRLATGS